MYIAQYLPVWIANNRAKAATVFSPPDKLSMGWYLRKRRRRRRRRRSTHDQGNDGELVHYRPFPRSNAVIAHTIQIWLLEGKGEKGEIYNITPVGVDQCR